jgi:hypothetical protein
VGVITIHKYPVLLGHDYERQMPKGATVLSVQMQRDQPMMWAMVDTDQPLVLRKFAVRGTGHDCSGVSHAFVGTFQYGALVFHLFDLGVL